MLEGLWLCDLVVVVVVVVNMAVLTEVVAGGVCMYVCVAGAPGKVSAQCTLRGGGATQIVAGAVKRRDNSRAWLAEGAKHHMVERDWERAMSAGGSGVDRVTSPGFSPATCNPTHSLASLPSRTPGHRWASGVSLTTTTTIPSLVLPGVQPAPIAAALGAGGDGAAACHLSWPAPAVPQHCGWLLLTHPNVLVSASVAVWRMQGSCR